MRKKEGTGKIFPLLLAAMLCVGNLTPATVKAAGETEKKNVLQGLMPETNAGEILNPQAATDGRKDGSNDDRNNTKITAGEEIKEDDNGYSQWQQVYLQYDLGEKYQLKEIVLYRNTYDAAVSTFKEVKVEVASSEDFSDSTVIFGTADYEEVVDTKGQPQTISLGETKEARYLRIWQKGHYIQNTNSDWKGYSNGVLFNEIEAFAEVPTTEPTPEPTAEPTPEPTTEPTPTPDPGEELVDANIMLGLQPTSNSPHKIDGGSPTVPQVQIKNPECATDGVIAGSDDDTNNTKIIAGQENGIGDNGYSGWDWVYLQYDFGKLRDVKEIKLYRNTYLAAVSDFKDVKVELSATEDFSNSTVVYGPQDYKETVNNKGMPQVIDLEVPVQAQYIRIWQKGHYIQNTNSSWKGYSNGVLFNEIEVIAPVPKSEVPVPPPEEEAKNIAQGKIPYVQGLEPTNIEAITDGNADENYAVHNSLGERWLQFEYKNTYSIKEIKFKLEEGTYQSVKVSISSSPNSEGTTVFEEKNWTQGSEINAIKLSGGKMGRYVRFTVNKDNNSPTKYSEIEIWATGKSYDESKPEYVAPQSKYNTLVWSDEFNGSVVDESKWNIIEGMANHGAIYNRGAVSIQKDGENSYLAINSKNYDTTDQLIAAVGLDRYQDQVLGSHVTWSSGRVESKNKFSFQFGRMAVRAKPNDSQGIWPAIWMLCQDETGHDEIDVLEYLGQNAWDAWTTNHFGILQKDKGSHGVATKNYEAWSQDFHVFEVEWDPEIIKFFIDGVQVHSTTEARDDGRDGMHHRSMFPILETQVGDGWVGPVDYTKQNTKQDSDFLVDWVRVYQMADQPVTRFDDLEKLSGGTNTEYAISVKSHTDGLMQLTDGKESYESKNNFYYGGQPRYENSRVAVKEGEKEQYLIYEVPGVKDVHLTTYYQTVEGVRIGTGDVKGKSMRSAMVSGGNLDFKIYTSPDNETWTEFENVKILDNFPEANPSYARHTFDAYGLPEGTNYVKVQFPDYEGAEYKQLSGQVEKVKNTDIQLAKVTFLQEKGAALPKAELESISITKAPDKTEFIEGETFEPAGMQVMAVYSDKTQKDVTAEVTYSKEALKTTDTEVEISYTEEGVTKTVSQKIAVKAKEETKPEKVTLESIEITQSPKKQVYTEGETFDPAGMQITARYSDGTTKDVTAEVTYSKETLKETDHTMEISYTENGITATVRQQIYVNKKGETGGTGGSDPTWTDKKPSNNGNNQNNGTPSGNTNTGKKNNVSNGAETGDNTPIAIWVVSAILAAGLVVGVGIKKKKYH